VAYTPTGGQNGDVLDEIAARVKAERGKVVAISLSGADVTKLVYELEPALDTGWDAVPDVRLVLGAACRTMHETIAQFVVALGLPYEASLGWDEFISGLGDRAASSRQCVVVADAQLLLADEPAARDELLYFVPSGPHCLGGGWSTVVLADSTTAAPAH